MRIAIVVASIFGVIALVLIVLLLKNKSDWKKTVDPTNKEKWNTEYPTEDESNESDKTEIDDSPNDSNQSND